MKNQRLENLAKSVLLIVLVFGVGSVFAQTQPNFQNITQTGANALGQEAAGFKQLMKWIMAFLAGGAFVYAIWTFYFRPEQSSRAIAGLVGGLIASGVAITLSFV